MEVNDNLDAGKEDKKTEKNQSDKNHHKFAYILDSIKTSSNLSDDAYRKIGFFCAVNIEKSESEQVLAARLSKLDDENAGYLLNIDGIVDQYLKSIEERIDSLKIQYQEKLSVKVQYDEELKKLNLERDAIDSELSELRTKVLKALSDISTSKEGLIVKRFDEIEGEINRLIEIHEQIENKQNPKYQSEYEADKQVDSQKIKFYENLKTDFQVTYDDVKKRMKVLNNAGINNFSSAILVGIGILSSFVAGWLFSMWSGPVPKFDKDKGTIIGNSSVRFSLIDLVAKFTSKKEWHELVIGIIAYLFLIGIVSFLCYFLLIKFSFLTVNGKSRRDEDLNFDLNEQDEMLTGKLTSNNFFGVWLKIAPIILFVFLTIAIVSQEAFQENGDKLQELFDSLTNQAMGQLSALAVTGIVYLYIIKIIEPRYLAKTDDTDKETGNILLSWEVMVTAIIFFVMFLLMILTHLLPETMSVFFASYSAIGYLFFCLSAGFSISFGLRFFGLDLAQNKLLNYLITCSNIINRLSKPRRDSYIDNQVFHQGIEVIQHQMLALIAGRNTLAYKLTSEKFEESPQKILMFPPFPSSPEPNEYKVNKQPDSDTAKTIEGEKENHSFLERLKNWFVINWIEMERKNEEEKNKNNETQILSRKVPSDEAAYFPAFSVQINEFNIQIRERTERIKVINAQQDFYWTEEGNYKILNQQIMAVNEKIFEVNNEKMEFQFLVNELKRSKNSECIHQETLIREGYLTGSWFLKENGDMYLPLPA